MKAAKVSYQRAASLAEALEVLSTGRDVRPLSGGQSLLPMLNMRLVRPEILLDLAEVPELAGGVERRGERLSIGALTRYQELERSSLVGEAARLLRTAVGFVGDLQVRNRGTVGGCLAQGDPTAEVPLACLVLDGVVHLESAARGRRSLQLSEFLVGPYETAIEPDELVIAVDVRASAGGDASRSAFAEATRRHNDFCIVSAAAVAVVGGDGTLEEITVGLGGVDDTPVVARRASEILTGQRPTEDVITAAAEACREEISPGDDTRASADYRRHLAGEYLRRVVGQVASGEEVRAA